MKTRHIRAFRAIVDTGSIRAAARKIGVSQPALTKTLRELETLLGVPLLLRSVRGVTLTEFGRALMPRVTLIEEEILRAREEISQMLGQKGSTVAIGLSAVVSLLISAQAMKLSPRNAVAAGIALPISASSASSRTSDISCASR